MAMKPRRLTSPSEIIDALGGNGPVAELTGSKPKTVSMWRTFDTLPTKTFLILDRELRERGFDVPPSVWGMIAADQVAS